MTESVAVYLRRPALATRGKYGLAISTSDMTHLPAKEDVNMNNLAAQASLDGERAGKFLRHADSTKSPATREMYLRLAWSEEALAERAERMAEESALKDFSKGMT